MIFSAQFHSVERINQDIKGVEIYYKLGRQTKIANSSQEGTWIDQENNELYDHS